MVLYSSWIRMVPHIVEYKYGIRWRKLMKTEFGYIHFGTTSNSNMNIHIDVLVILMF
jgi:hypothetical protein